MNKENLQQKDQSMEEILQSIKRIIAEEGEEPKKAAPAADISFLPDAHVKGSDILDFEQIVAKDLAEKSAGVLELTDTVDDEEEEDEEPATPMIAQAPAKQPAPASPKPAPAPTPAATKKSEPKDGNRDVLADIDSLLSDESAKASAAAMQALAENSRAPRPAPVRQPSPEFRSGQTVEDLVVEALKPMLKSWLDANLPGMVQHLVEKEIRKLSG